MQEYVYQPRPNDTMDYEVAKVVNAKKETISIPIVRLKKGYLIGTQVHVPFIKADRLVFRIGGGYSTFEEYLNLHQKDEHDKIQLIMKKTNKTY